MLSSFATEYVNYFLSAQKMLFFFLFCYIELPVKNKFERSQNTKVNLKKSQQETLSNFERNHKVEMK